MARGTKEQFKKHLLICAPIMFFSALTGVLSGITVILYTYVAEFITHGSQFLYQKVIEAPAFIPLLFLGLAILAFISYVIVRFIPEARGTGITATEARDRALQPIPWWRAILGTILGSFASFFAGLSLGVEGPSTAIGSAIGSGVSKFFKSKKRSESEIEDVRKLVSVSGVSSAITSAFNAPISGLIFTLEELDNKFSPYVVLAACSSVVTSLFTSASLRSLLGMEQRLLSVSLTTLPFSSSWSLLLLGVVCGLLAVSFSKILVLIKEISFVKKTPLIVKLIIVYFITGVVGLFLYQALGSGLSLLRNMLTLDFTWWMLLVILIVKMILSTLVMGSESIGGLLLPTLTIGALIGALMGKAFLQMGIPEDYYLTFIILGSAAFMGATFRSPITAIVLIIEITGSFSNGFAIGVEVLIAFMIAELFDHRPKTKELL